MKVTCRWIVMAIAAIVILSVIVPAVAGANLLIGRVILTPSPTQIIKTPTLGPTPASIEITLSRDYVDADGLYHAAGGDRITVRAKVTDSHGTPVADGFLVNFAIDEPGWTQDGPGSLGTSWGVMAMNSCPTTKGIASVEFGDVLPRFAGSTVKLTATCSDYPSVKASTSVNVKPLTIKAELSRDYVTADGSDKITVTARVSKSDGSPVADGFPVNFVIDQPGWTQDGPGSLGNAPGIMIMSGCLTKNGVVDVDYGGVASKFAGSTVKLTVTLAGNNLTRDSKVVNIVPVDTVPPVTTMLLAGTTASDGTFTTPAQVTLSAADGSGSGVKTIEYGFDGDTWNTYTGPFTISSAGMTTVYYRSKDLVNNVETPKVKAIVLAAPIADTPAPGSATPSATQAPVSTPPASADNGTATIQPSDSPVTTPVSGKSGLPFTELTLVSLAAAGIIGLAGRPRKKY
jgi:hypothetical protein